MYMCGMELFWHGKLTPSISGPYYSILFFFEMSSVYRVNMSLHFKTSNSMNLCNMLYCSIIFSFRNKRTTSTCCVCTVYITCIYYTNIYTYWYIQDHTYLLRYMLVHTWHVQRMYLYSSYIPCTCIVHVSMACFIMGMYFDKTIWIFFRVSRIWTVNLMHTARLFRPLRYERNNLTCWIYCNGITILNSWRGLTWSLVSNVWRRPPPAPAMP
jgi:hypothetical protein